MKHKSQSGFTILEALVAAIILMVALLGMGALQSTTMRKNDSAVNKVQAMEAINYIGDAIRTQASSKEGAEGVAAVYDTFTADYWNGNNYQSQFVEDCGVGCTRVTMAQHMLAEWEKMIGESLPQGKGQIEQMTEDMDVDGQTVSTTFYKITVMWDDRQMAQIGTGGTGTLGTDCSGNPTVDLACFTTIVRP